MAAAGPVPPALVDPPARAARVTFGVLFALAAGLTLAVVWSFLGPLFLAAVLASVLHRGFERLARALGGHRAAAAGLSTLGLLLLLLGPLAAFIGFTAGQIVDGLAFVRDRLGIHSVEQLEKGRFSPHGQALINRTLAALHLSPAQLEEWTLRGTASAEHGAERVLAHSSSALFDASVMLIAFYFLLLEGRRLIEWLALVSPLQPRHTRDLLEEFRLVSRATVLGALLAALFQGAAATAGYLVCGVPHAVFFGGLTLIASFVPVVGTLLVWVPAVVLLWLFGHHLPASLLFGWCLVLVVGAEHLGKPLVLSAILGGERDMHAGVVFLSLLGGIETFGLIGIVLGPLVLAFFLAMVRIYQRDFLVPAATSR